MQHFTTQHTAPITLDRSTESKVYGLFALAMGITVIGVYGGFLFAPLIMNSGLLFALTIIELGIIFTAGMWMNARPWNIILFGLFPLLSGITITPYLMHLLVGYANGASILLNALVATTCMAAAAAIFARTTSINLGIFGRTLFFALLGMIFFSLAQIFIPALQTTTIELFFSGFGILLFAAFTAYDVQRIQVLAAQGASPFLLALSLYLDIFNMFLMILRFMTALSGDRN